MLSGVHFWLSALGHYNKRYETDAPGAWVLSALGARQLSYCLYRASDVMHVCCFRFFLLIAAYRNVDRIIKRYDAFFDSGYVLAVYNKWCVASYKKIRLGSSGCVCDGLTLDISFFGSIYIECMVAAFKVNYVWKRQWMICAALLKCISTIARLRACSELFDQFRKLSHVRFA